MPPLRPQLARAFLLTIFVSPPTLALSQSASSPPEIVRMHLTQEQLCCFDINFVKPVYPRQARLAHVEGEVKVVLEIVNNSIASLQVVSGDPLLVDSTVHAIHQWRFDRIFGGYVGSAEVPREIEIPISFTFKIEAPPKPAYLYLTNGKVIRVEDVREFTNYRLEYEVGNRTRHISSESVKKIAACKAVVRLELKEGECIPGGGPSFTITAIPLLPSPKAMRPAN
jgi:hypothetical protein